MMEIAQPDNQVDQHSVTQPEFQAGEMSNPGSDPLGRALARLNEAAKDKTHITLGEMLAAVDVEGPAIAAALLVLPFLQPIPLMGLSAPVGLTIALSGVGMFLGKPVILPKRLATVKLTTPTIVKMSEFLISFEKKLKPYIKNDANFESPVIRKFLGICIAIHAFLLALPLPIPFTNAMPAWMCFLAALTVLFSSRRVFWLSTIMIVANVAFWTSLVLAAVWGLPSLVEWTSNSAG